MSGSISQMALYQKSADNFIFKENFNYINSCVQLLPISKILFHHVAKKILVLPSE